MDIQHHLDGRVLTKIFFDRFKTAVICAAVTGIIVQGSIMDRFDARSVELFCDLFSHSAHVFTLFGRSREKALVKISCVIRQIAFGGMGMIDQHLRFIRFLDREA